ncbi:aminopeptidase N, partial [Bordetella pertussis]
RLTHREERVRTQSGRDVLLQVYSDPGSENRTEWALESLRHALRWDESRFGLELDLDRFMVVAVRDFNMGAMENKGLNIFNAAYVLADPATATDANYEGIESVIGHEYFHNWTGNRVTCRDWFQLSLKEGLTVFRDQEFSADMMARGLDEQAAASARAVKRIDDVVTLRAAQFPEDAGPMAHPIRPDSYQEIGNFYTATVYEKGAEVIRMQHTLLGEPGFRAGMDE